MERQRRSVLDELRTRITTGLIPPGSHLTERGLAEEYEISRTPVRSILRELADQGLVTVAPNRGVFVAEWTTSDAAEVMSIRALLESHAAKLAAENRTAEQMENLSSLCDRMDALEETKNNGYRAEIASLNHELHLLILEAAASPRLFNIAKDLAMAPLMSGSFQYYSDEELRRSLQDHRLILDALKHRDGERARALMEGHLRTAYAALSRRSGAETSHR